MISDKNDLLKQLIFFVNEPNELQKSWVYSNKILGKCFICNKEFSDDCNARLHISQKNINYKDVLVCSDNCGYEHYKHLLSFLSKEIIDKQLLFDKTADSIKKLEVE